MFKRLGIAPIPQLKIFHTSTGGSSQSSTNPTFARLTSQGEASSTSLQDMQLLMPYHLLQQQTPANPISLALL